jgi:hypothetical protein
MKHSPIPAISILRSASKPWIEMELMRKSLYGEVSAFRHYPFMNGHYPFMNESFASVDSSPLGYEPHLGTSTSKHARPVLDRAVKRYAIWPHSRSHDTVCAIATWSDRGW